MGQKIHPIGLRLGITQPHRSKGLTLSNQTRKRWLLQDQTIRQYIKQNFNGINQIYIKHYNTGINYSSISGDDTKEQSVENTWNVDTIYVELLVTDQPEKIKRSKWNKQYIYTLQEPLLEQQLNQVCSTINLPYMWQNKFKPKVTVTYHKHNPLKKHSALISEHIAERLECRESPKKVLNQVLSRLQKRPKFEVNMQRHKKRKKPISKQLKRIGKFSGFSGLRIQISGRLDGVAIASVIWDKIGRIPLQTLNVNIDYVCQVAKTRHGLLGIKVWTVHGMH